MKQRFSGYNGWSNYETWLCKLWMDEDGTSEIFYEECRENLLNEDSDSYEEDAGILAGNIKSYFEDMVEGQLPRSGFITDLVNNGLNEVNWLEIAKSLIDEC